MLRNSGHHHTVSRGALKVQGVRSIVADRYSMLLDAVHILTDTTNTTYCISSITFVKRYTLMITAEWAGWNLGFTIMAYKLH